MTELDVKLRSLRALPTDPRLDALGDVVLQQLGVRRDARIARQQVMMTAVLALMIGMAGSMLPGKHARAAATGDALTGTPGLAPSQLLGR